jgi:hypothetical protein
MYYKKKPVVIQAVQWNGGDFEILNDFCGKNWTRADAIDYNQAVDKEQVVVFNTAEKAWIHVPVGHWIIRGIKGELYPCEPEIFKVTYDEVDYTPFGSTIS